MKMSEFDKINSTSLYESLDKWDKMHIPNLKNDANLIKKISYKLKKEYDDIQFDNLNFKKKISKKLPRLKTLTKNKKIQNFYKNIETENSNVLAQNINIAKKRFDFNIFESPEKNINLDKINNNFKRKENDELWKVGKEIGIRKKIVFNTKTEIKHNFEDFEEINIEDKVLKLNDLKLEGNYTKVTSYDYYKNVLGDKKKIEKNFRNEILKLIKEIKEKENNIENLNMEITDLTNENERKKKIYYDNLDVIKVIKFESEKLDLRNISNFQKKTLLKRKIEDLEKILETSKKEYLEQKEITEKKIPELKEIIHINKLELKNLEEILKKKKKKNIKYFKNLLKEGVDVRDVGLCWILFRLNELGAKIEKTDFPKFLDYVSIKYLIEYSEKIIKMNKLKIILDLIKGERKNIMKSVDLGNLNLRNKYNLESNEISIENNVIIPYDNINEFLKELFHKFKLRMGNRFVILENVLKEKDEMYLKNAQEEIRKMVPSYKTNKIRKRNHFLTESYTINEYNKYQLNLTPKQINTVDTIITIKNFMSKIDKEMKNIRSEHLYYFKRKYENMKLKGTSECIKYDLMFCALFGNFAVY